MMQSAHITLGASTIHYSYGGNGPQLLICFHGYGESEKSFHFLEKYLGDRYRMVAIDFPFHGGTTWQQEAAFTVQDLLAIVRALVSEHGRGRDRFTVMGFSMGGRVALSLLQAIPAQIDKLILLAPDGLKVNPWYWLATQTFIGNRLFRYTMKYPGWFFFLLNLANRLGIINQSVYKFTRHYIHDEAIRFELYHRWTSMRTLRPHLDRIKAQVRENTIPVRLLYGEYDRIILPVRGELFRKGIEQWCTLQVVPSGHQVLQEKNAAVIVALL